MLRLIENKELAAKLEELLFLQIDSKEIEVIKYLHNIYYHYYLLLMILRKAKKDIKWMILEQKEILYLLDWWNFWEKCKGHILEIL